MTENYEQKINISPTKKQRILKRISFVFGLITLAFAIPAGLVSLYYLIGTIINIILAFLCNQLYLGSPQQFIVEINRTRYTVSETNRFGKTAKIFDERLDGILDVSINLAKDIDIDTLEFTKVNSCFKENVIDPDTLNLKKVICYLDKNNVVDNQELTLIRHIYDKNNCFIVVLPLDTYAQQLLIENIKLGK